MIHFSHAANDSRVLVKCDTCGLVEFSIMSLSISWSSCPTSNVFCRDPFIFMVVPLQHCYLMGVHICDAKLGIGY